MSTTEAEPDAEPEKSEEIIEKETQEYRGSAYSRKEDYDILTGRREYVHDRNPPDALHAAYVRSSHAHAHIENIDTSKAENHPDCEAVITLEDYKEMGYLPMIGGVHDWMEYPLADGKVTYVGQPVVMVVGTDRYVAEDIAELVTIEYEPLEPVIDAMEARDDDNILYPDQGPDDQPPSNVAFDETFNFGEAEEKFEEADHVIEREFDWSGRPSGVPLETPSALAKHNDNMADGESEFHIFANQQLHALADVAIYTALDLPREEVRLETPLTAGGSYGTKQQTVYRHCVLTAVAAEMTGKPVKYVEDRLEDLQGGDSAASDRHYEARLAFNDDGDFLTLDLWFTDNFGAFPRWICTHQVLKPVAIITGPYDIDHVDYHYEVVLTNKMPQSAYRGFGTQPHNYVLEMLVDEAARTLDMDPTEIRHQNYIPEEDMPSKRPSKNVYGEGNYSETLRKVTKLAEKEYEEDGLLAPDVVEEKRAEGKYRGAGAALALEPGLGGADYLSRHFVPKDVLESEYTPENRTLEEVEQVPEPIEVQINTDGKVEAIISSDSAGQGHQTIVSQMLADELGCHPDDVLVPKQDNLDVATSIGSASSRMATVLSSAAIGVGEKLRGQLEELAAEEWNCDLENVEYSIERGGIEHIESDEFMTLAELAQADRLTDAGLSDETVSAERKTRAYYLYDDVAFNNIEYFKEAILHKYPTYPSVSFAADIPIVEVDIETGEVEVFKIYTVRDCGRIMNKLLVEGQAHGGIAQGIGAALQEEFAYDENGQPQSSTFFEYKLPSIENVPEIELKHQETWSAFTKSGAKGVGETGIMDMPAAIAHSINDALEPLDILVTELPATSDRVRHWIREADETETTAD